MTTHVYLLTHPRVHVRCECGEMASVRVPITVIAATGHPIGEWLYLCPVCYAEHLRIEAWRARQPATVHCDAHDRA